MTDIEMIKLSGHLNLPKESLCLLSFLMIISKKKIFYYQIVVALPLMDKVITCLAMIETIYCCDLSRFPDTALFSTHIISANGEILPPYQQLSSNDSFMICNQHQILQTCCMSVLIFKRFVLILNKKSSTIALLGAIN